jgi:hypothetical protein
METSLKKGASFAGQPGQSGSKSDPRQNTNRDARRALLKANEVTAVLRMTPKKRNKDGKESWRDSNGTLTAPRS